MSLAWVEFMDEVAKVFTGLIMSIPLVCWFIYLSRKRR